MEKIAEKLGLLISAPPQYSLPMLDLAVFTSRPYKKFLLPSQAKAFFCYYAQQTSALDRSYLQYLQVFQ